MPKTIDRNTTDEDAKNILIKMSEKGLLPFTASTQTTVKRFTNGNQSLPLAVHPDGKTDNEFVIRMPRSQAAAEEMKRDSQFSKFLTSYIQKTQIPKVQFIENEEDIPIAIHRSIQGKTMDFAGQEDTLHYHELSEKQKELLAKDLAVFFNELHQIPTNNQSFIPQSNVKYYHQEKAPKYKKLMQQFGINMENFETGKKEDMVCCHNDCHGGNMAFDIKKEHVLQGVFDFGMCGINNRSSDFVKLYQIDRELARLTIAEYNKISPQQVDIKDVDKQYLAWLAENLMLPEKAPEQWDEASRHKLSLAVGKTLIKFKRDLNREKQEDNSIDNNNLLNLSGRIPKEMPQKPIVKTNIQNSKQTEFSL